MDNLLKEVQDIISSVKEKLSPESLKGHQDSIRNLKSKMAKETDPKKKAKMSASIQQMQRYIITHSN